MGYLGFPATYSGEYRFGGFPRLCLKGSLYPTEVLISLEDKVGCITSDIFSEGVWSSGTVKEEGSCIADCTGGSTDGSCIVVCMGGSTDVWGASNSIFIHLSLFRDVSPWKGEVDNGSGK